MSLVEKPRPERPQVPLDLSELRTRTRSSRGKAYWRSLEELAGTPEFRDFLEREFAAPLSEGVDRRDFLRLGAASLALAGVTACTRQPTEKIVPYVRAPEEVVPGRPLFYATALTLGGYATGVLVESHEGRPTKVEGNPQHPASLGGTDVFAQASILTLYDPDRSSSVTNRGEIASWPAFLSALRIALERERRRGGDGIRLLTGTVTSPTLASQLAEILAAFPRARWHQWEPAGGDSARAGTRLAFGAPLALQRRLERADVILALDSDFLNCGPAHLSDVRRFGERRRPEAAGGMNRLYAIESAPSNTGAAADHRFPMRASEVEAAARAVAAALGIGAVSGPPPSWAAAVARDLAAHRGRSLVVAGEHQPPRVHALAHAMNAALGNFGQTVIATDPIEVEPVDQLASIRELASDMEAGRVQVLLIAGGNPVFDAPADLEFARRMARVPLRVHLGLYEDETSELCHWHVPQAHELESWGDARAYDGTVTIQQPLIAPLFGGRSAHELLAAFTDRPEQSAYAILREIWQKRLPGDFERTWRRALHDGVVAGTAFPERAVQVRADAVNGSQRDRSGIATGSQRDREGIEVLLRPDPTLHDGRFANNGWLQELPKPLTKLTWDNAVLVSPRLAEAKGLQNGDVVSVSAGGRSVNGPVWIDPGSPAGVATIHFGQGRRRAGRVGSGTGFDAYPLRTSSALWTVAGATLEKLALRRPLACTQGHFTMENRDLIRMQTLERHGRGETAGAEPETGPPQSFYAEHPYDGYRWGMAIDLSACVGCNACMVACQAENNVPVVGKDQVLRGREMHWLRVDRYFTGDLDSPESAFQPVPCMHCEKAPCEPVCPVAATVHSAEGLNDMVYNRCIGTRYCSNNCPYKVRRFNFYNYAKEYGKTTLLPLLANPDVTVRFRGVMEKCTYCVQRINGARIAAEKEGRRIRDGEIVTACQQACGARAIVFGDLNDPKSEVVRWKADRRNYALLAELGTIPRTTYLAVVRNPNPDLAGGAA